MRRFCAILLCLTLLCGCAPDAPLERRWSAGFGAVTLSVDLAEPYYLAGYHNGVPPEGIRDLPRLSALWLDDGATAILLLSIDCVGLDAGTVADLRDALSDFRRATDCDAIHVVATHTHASVDTLGLWGPIGQNGKNADFMARLIDAAVPAAEAAYADRRPGRLAYRVTATDGLQRDSRDPQVYDPNLYQLHFTPDDGTRGLRIWSFAAHAEALRGKNRLISRDFPGEVADLLLAETGDESLFLPGAVGGLIMTRELVEVTDQATAEANLVATARRLADAILAPTTARTLTPDLATVTVEYETPLENTLFLYYQFLGILHCTIVRRASGYTTTAEVSLVRLGELTLALMPGEVFPEALDLPTETLPINLANGELGYILPPADFVLDDRFPYVEAADGHYEETNSTSPEAAEALRRALDRAAAMLS